MTDANDPIQQTPNSEVPIGGGARGEVELIIRPESRLFGHTEGQALGIEQFRLLLARLSELHSRGQLKKLLISSAWWGEGKTHIAANLALTIARETDRKILLVDADVCKPNVHNVYGITNDGGLTDVLRDGHDLWKAIRKVRGLNLYVLTAGSVTAQPLTTTSLLTLKALLEQISPVFDWVIIDSPPILLGAGVPLLAKLSDGVLLVVRGFRTQRELLEKAKRTLGKGIIIGAVLNGVNPLRARYCYYEAANGQKNKKKRRKE